jgi:hypothetical protein
MTTFDVRIIITIVWAALVILVGLLFLSVLLRQGGKGVGAPLFRCLMIAVIAMIGYCLRYLTYLSPFLPFCHLLLLQC